MSSVTFHPSENMLLTTGLDRKAKLIQLAGKSYDQGHQIVQQLYLQDLPIYKGGFIRQGKEAIFAGNRRHFYTYELEGNKLVK